MRKLRGLGFEGPISGTKHQFLIFGQHRQTLPTNAEYSVPQLRMLLRQVGAILGREIALDEWNSL
ncbi:MAG TPA: type II toxin-antitoxin system HicA family toxin [Verrucomicrobiae bacterium]